MKAKTERTARTKNLSTRDGYLKRKFGRTEAEYNQALAEQNGVCKCCGRPPGAKALHVDHDHKIEKWKIVSQKISGTWYAWPDGFYLTALGSFSSRLHFGESGRTKSLAISAVKAKLKRLSVRGLLCWQCNTGLKKYQDDHERLTKAGAYLLEYNRFIDGFLNKTNGFGE